MATSFIQPPAVTLEGEVGSTQDDTIAAPVVPEPVIPVSDTSPLILTKYQFRKLFTLAERTAVDNAQYNTTLSGSQKAAIFTIQKDLEVSGEVDLHLPDVIKGVNYLVSCGIITAVRARAILANTPPANN